MGYTNAQRVNIIYFMGWPQLYLQVWSELNYAIQATEADPDIMSLVLDIVASCQNIDAELLTALKYIKVDQVDSIINRARMAHINILRSEGARLVGRLSSTLNVPRRADVFNYGGNKGSNVLTIV